MKKKTKKKSENRYDKRELPESLVQKMYRSVLRTHIFLETCMLDGCMIMVS